MNGWYDASESRWIGIIRSSLALLAEQSLLWHLHFSHSDTLASGVIATPMQSCGVRNKEDMLQSSSNLSCSVAAYLLRYKE